MNSGGRITICGTVGIDSAELGVGPRLERAILERELSVHGFLQSRYESESPLLVGAPQSWFDAGDLRLREDITPGLSSLTAALEGLLRDRISERCYSSLPRRNHET